MPKGGHGRSGPRPDENSGRSERRGLSFTTLPCEGYAGEVPGFPLPQPRGRELELWRDAWRTPQACAWAVEPWRQYTVAQWVRWSVRAEDPDASAAVVAQMIRLADQVGMTPAGLKENGWKVATDEPDDDQAGQVEQTAARPSSRSRLKVVAGGDG